MVSRFRRGRTWVRMGALAVVSTMLSGCAWEEGFRASWANLPRYGWPSGASAEGRYLSDFWAAAFTLSLVIGVVVWALMFWTFTRHRKKPDSPLYPKQTRENNSLEIVYTAIPFVLIGILFYFSYGTENRVLEKDPNPAVTVQVTAFKWNWEFGYVGLNGPDGRQVSMVGTTNEIPILVVPSGKIIQYELESRDVIHSFWVPDFLFKRDAFPHPKANGSDNVFQNTIEHEGAFVGRCAELCGTYHSMMNFEVRAISPQRFDRFIQLRQQTNPDTGSGYTTAQALATLGTEDPACGALCSPTATTTSPFDPSRTRKAPGEPAAVESGS